MGRPPADAQTRGPDRFLIDQYVREARQLQAEAHAAPAPPRQRSRPSRDPRWVRELVEPHLFYVLEVAGALQGRGVPLEDLLAEGNIGLVEAAHRFDPRRQVKFLTYASWWIRKRILAFLARESGAVRLTRHARDLRRGLLALRDELRTNLQREPTLDELAASSGMAPDTVRRHVGAALKVYSLDATPFATTRRPLSELLADGSVGQPEEAIERQRLNRIVRREVARLPERERIVIECRFGMAGRSPLTFEELGDLLGVSRERARQLEHAALGRLRRRISVRGPRLAPNDRPPEPH